MATGGDKFAKLQADPRYQADLTESLPESELIGAQGLADVLMSLLGLATAFSSGFVLAAVGYEWPANFATAPAALILIGALRVSARLASARAG